MNVEQKGKKVYGKLWKNYKYETRKEWHIRFSKQKVLQRILNSSYKGDFGSKVKVTNFERTVYMANFEVMKDLWRT